MKKKHKSSTKPKASPSVKMETAVWPTFGRAVNSMPGTWNDATGTPLADVEKAKEVPREPAPVPGIVAIVADLDATIERLEHRLIDILRAKDPAAHTAVSASDLARRIERSVLALNEIIERVDV